jgi:diguanylate cyclase (GGDEF)-like protein/PAS domain S-box-containing protein
LQPTDGIPLVWAEAILEGLPDAVVATGRDERIVFANALAAELFGYRRSDLLGMPAQQLWPERLRERYTRNMHHYFETEHPLRFSEEVFGLRRDGSEFAGEMSWGVVRTDDALLLLAIGRDITARRATEARLRALATMSARALGGADPAQLAADAEELLRTTLPVDAAAVRLPGGQGEPFTEALLHLPFGAGGELMLTPRRVLSDEEMTLVHAVGNILATAMARLHDEEQMRHDALHDPLTGLANRTLLHDRLRHAVAQSARGRGDTCVLFVDLDDFKLVNDEHGHQIGDELLATLGGRLRTAVRPADTVARMGGDEFVVVCENIDLAGALALADRLEAAIAEPIRASGAGGEHRLSASIGIALGHGGAGEALLRNADAAVYRAKAAGGARIEVFSG